MSLYPLTHAEVLIAACTTAEKIKADLYPNTNPVHIYGWPRGGIPCAYLVQRYLKQLDVACEIAEYPGVSDVVIDDLYDSGKTAAQIQKEYPNAKFYTLFDKRDFEKGAWLQFPWEVTAGIDASGDDIVIRLLQYIGEDPQRGGLVETPKRVLKAWREMTCGYNIDPHTLLKTFEDGAEGVDEMVTVQHIPVWSLCEHHMLPFFGHATVSYIPDKKIVGLSKLARVVDAFARRLQVQERLTNQIADLLQEELQPIGVGVHLRCRHLCMELRGVKTHDSQTVTTALRGVLKEDHAAREEFLRLTNGGKHE